MSDSVRDGGEIEVSIDLDGPLDVAASVEPFRRWGDDRIDRWDGKHLVRTVPVGGSSAAYMATITGTIDAPALRVTVEDGASVSEVERGVRASFVPAPPEFTDLLRHDPVVAALNERFRGLRTVLQLDLLSALIRSISAQQVNLVWASTTRRRLVERFGHIHNVGGHQVYSFAAEPLAAATVAEIREMQFTTRKAEYIIGVAEAVASGRLRGDELAGLSNEEVIDRLTALRGIGRWTAEWILARTLGRSVVVAGDLGVRKAVGKGYFESRTPSEAEVRVATEHWGESAGMAQLLVLQGLVEEAG